MGTKINQRFAYIPIGRVRSSGGATRNPGYCAQLD